MALPVEEGPRAVLGGLPGREEPVAPADDGLRVQRRIETVDDLLGPFVEMAIGVDDWSHGLSLPPRPVPRPDQGGRETFEMGRLSGAVRGPLAPSPDTVVAPV